MLFVTRTIKMYTLSITRMYSQDYVNQLANIGIVNVEQMIQRGSSPEKRTEIAEQTDVRLDYVLEFVKLSDLTRLGAVKSILARLYYDAGIDTIEKMAQYDPIELRSFLIEWIEQSGFEGIAPLPKEAVSAVETARKLPKLVVFE